GPSTRLEREDVIDDGLVAFEMTELQTVEIDVGADEQLDPLAVAIGDRCRIDHELVEDDVARRGRSERGRSGDVTAGQRGRALARFVGCAGCAEAAIR